MRVAKILEIVFGRDARGRSRGQFVRVGAFHRRPSDPRGGSSTPLRDDEDARREIPAASPYSWFENQIRLALIKIASHEPI